MKKIPVTGSFLFIIAGFLFFLASCEKVSDGTAPVVEFYGPPANTEVLAGDTIRVIAGIGDDKMLNSVQLSLVNSQLVNLTTPSIFYPSGNTYTLDHLYPINNTNLTEGSYELLIIADDGFNRTRRFRTIRITNTDQEVNAFILVKKLNSEVSRVEVLTPSLNIDTVFNIQQRYSLSGVNSKFGLFYYAKQSPAFLTAYNTFDYKPEWDRQAGLPYSEFVYQESSEYFYISTGNGNIFGYDGEGSNVFQTDALEDYIPETFHAFDDFLIASQEMRNGPLSFIVIYYLSTGFEKNRINISEEIAGISSSGNLFYIFMNDGLNGLVKSLNPEELIYTEERRLNGVYFRQVTRIDDNTFLISTDDGIYEYNRYLNRFTEYSDIEADFTRYEPFSDRLFIVSGDDVKVLDYSAGNEIGEIGSADEVLDLHILYNK